MQVIGIDPGLMSTGVGMVRGMHQKIDAYSFCTITTDKKIHISNRLQTIFDRIKAILIEHQPQIVIIEDIFSLTKFPESGIVLGKVTGVILLAASQLNIPIFEVPVREAKKILTGNGNANKKQLENAICHLLNRLEPLESYHASDALALAVIGLFRNYGDNIHDRFS